jgi:hypothetical protein
VNIIPAPLAPIKVLPVVIAPAAPPQQPTSMAGVNIKAIQPEPFYGLPTEDADEWMKRLIAYFTATKTEEGMKCTIFQLLLQNVASVWFKSLSATDQVTTTKD